MSVANKTVTAANVADAMIVAEVVAMTVATVARVPKVAVVEAMEMEMRANHVAMASGQKALVVMQSPKGATKMSVAIRSHVTRVPHTTRNR